MSRRTRALLFPVAQSVSCTLNRTGPTTIRLSVFATIESCRFRLKPVERAHSQVATLSVRVRQELEQFAVAATALEGKDVRIVGWSDAEAALKLVRDSAAGKR